MTGSLKPCAQYGDCGVSWQPDTEEIPLLEEGGLEGFFRREVLPYVLAALVSRAVGSDRQILWKTGSRSLVALREQTYTEDEESLVPLAGPRL